VAPHPEGDETKQGNPAPWPPPAHPRGGRGGYTRRSPPRQGPSRLRAYAEALPAQPQSQSQSQSASSHTPSHRHNATRRTQAPTCKAPTTCPSPPARPPPCISDRAFLEASALEALRDHGTPPLSRRRLNTAGRGWGGWGLRATVLAPSDTRILLRENPLWNHRTDCGPCARQGAPLQAIVLYNMLRVLPELRSSWAQGRCRI